MKNKRELKRYFTIFFIMLLIVSSIPMNGKAQESENQTKELGDYEIISQDTMITQDSIFEKDVIIAPGVNFTIQSGANVEFNGDLIVYGNMANHGIVNMNGNTIFANYVTWKGMTLIGDSNFSNFGRIVPLGDASGMNLNVKTSLYPLAVFAIDKQEETVPSTNYTIKGKTIPGFKVLINDSHSVIADREGNFEWTTTLTETINHYSLQAQDVFQRKGEVKTVVITYDETAVPPPPAPHVEPLTEVQELIKGKTEPQAKVMVKKDELKIAEGQADAEGNFEINVGKHAPGTVLTVTATNAQGKESAPTIIEVSEVPPPPSPKVEPLTNKQEVLKGIAEPLATLIVKREDLKIAEGEADSEGIFSINVGKQSPGTKLSVTATNAHGKESDPTVIEVIEVGDLKVTASTPAPNDTLGFMSQHVSISFNNNNLKAGSDFDGISLNDNNGNKVSIHKSIMDNTLEVSWSGSLTKNQTYSLTVPTDGIIGPQGETLPESYVLAFKTGNETQFSGGIYENVTWKKENSPYYITGDVVVFPDATLTIEPGVKVNFLNGKKLTVRGQLKAEGTSENGIIFTSMNQSGKNDWPGILLDKSHVGKTSMKHVEISHATIGLSVTDSSSDGEDMPLTNLLIKNNQTGISVYSDFEISQSRFEGNGVGAKGSVRVINNVFTNNDKAINSNSTYSIANTFSNNRVGIQSYNGTVLFNKFHQNDLGLQADGPIMIEKNTFDQNASALVLKGYQQETISFNNFIDNTVHVNNQTSYDKFLTNNWWGTINETAIQEKMIDGHKDISKGLVNFKPISNQTFVTEGTITPEWKQGAELTYSVTDKTIQLYWDRTKIQQYPTVSAFKIIVNGREEKVLESWEGNYELTLPHSEQPYEISIQAKNIFGNWSTNGPKASIKLIDNYAPYWKPEDTISLEQISGSKAKLDWPAAMDNDRVTQYIIRVNGDIVKELSSDILTYTVEGLKTHQFYNISVEAVDNSGNVSGAFGKGITLEDMDAPVWPENASIEANYMTETTVTLSWPRPSDASGLEYIQTLNGEKLLSTYNSDTVRHVSNLMPNTEYTFTVQASDGKFKSDVLSITFKTPDETAPVWEGESDLEITNIKDTSLDLQWPAAVDAGGVSKYRILMNGEVIKTLDAELRSHRVTGLQNDTEYRFVVEAADPSGNWSTNGLKKTVRTMDKTAPTWPRTSEDFMVDEITETSISFRWVEATDTSKVKEYILYVDGVEKKRQAGNGIVLSGLKPGITYQLKLEAVDTLGNKSTTGPSYSFKTKGVGRINGSSRYDTAATISKTGWDKAETVIIARGDSFPDALAGAPLAKKLNAPILLTDKSSLSYATKTEIKRLGAKKIIILGGPSAVENKVADELKGMGMTVERINGKDRFDTANQIAKKVGENKKVVLAYGYNFPDALAVASYAASKGYPILLTDKNSIAASTKQLVKEYGTDQVLVVGGEGVISNQVLQSLSMNNIRRIAGSNRFETAAKIIETLTMKADSVYIANGNGFADALTGSVLAAKHNAPLLLVNSDSLPWATKRIITNNPGANYTILGGAAAVDQKVASEMAGLMR